MPHQAWRRVWGKRKRGRSRRYQQAPIGMSFSKRHLCPSGPKPPDPLTSAEQCYTVGFFGFFIFLFTFLCLGLATIFSAVLLAILIAVRKFVQPVAEVVAKSVFSCVLAEIICSTVVALCAVALSVSAVIYWAASIVGRNKFFCKTVNVAISVIRILGGLAFFWVVGPISRFVSASCVAHFAKSSIASCQLSWPFCFSASGCWFFRRLSVSTLVVACSVARFW